MDEVNKMQQDEIQQRVNAIFNLFKGMTFDEMQRALFVLNGEAYLLFVKESTKEVPNANPQTTSPTNSPTPTSQ